MNKHIARARVPLLLALSIVGTMSTAHADARVASSSLLQVLPGAERSTFHDGDPIRLCYGSRSQHVSDASVMLVIEQRQVREGAHWRLVVQQRVQLNSTHCWTTQVRVNGEHDPDLQLRTRTVRSPLVERSTSRVVTIGFAS